MRSALNGETRYLVVNADDFGLSAGVNAGIIEAHERGIVTSASLMVRWPAAVEAAHYGRSHSELSLGLHLDFAEWRLRNGEWELAYQVAPTNDPAAVDAEIGRQVEAFRELVGSGPTHLDSHQHLHLKKNSRPVVEEWGRKLQIPVRRCTPDLHYCGSFYGLDENGEEIEGALSAASLCAILKNLRAGWTELACHPGFAADLDSDYSEPRSREVEALSAAEVRETIRELGIELCSFAAFRDELRPHR